MQTKEIQVLRVTGESADRSGDSVAVEEPLEVGLSYQAGGRQTTQTISVTMRTPGDDSELALGYLFSEGIIDDMSHVDAVSESRDNRVDVALASAHAPDLSRLQRHSYMSSSCGVCGKASIEALQIIGATRLPLGTGRVDRSMLQGLPKVLSKNQDVFEQTGGLHAAALYDLEGNLLIVREDVGRHNALDKLIGACLRVGALPRSERVLLLSGRISFELVQKALRAQISIIAAIGAPSSLAIELATEYHITTVGFLRHHRFNVYSASERIVT